MLAVGDLANTIIGNMKQADNPFDAHANFGAALKNYLMQNLRLKGVYNGVLTGAPPPPDPNNGEYKWKIAEFNFVADNLRVAAQNGLSGWEEGMVTEFNKILFVGGAEGGIITTTAPANLLVGSVNIDMSSKPDNMNDAIIKVAEGIINALLSASASPTTVAATSTAGGQGTVAWTGVE